MKNYYAFFCFVLFSFMANAQTEVGHYMNSNGSPIVGYIDQLGYSNWKGITIELTTPDFLEGYYYDSSGEKVAGLIQFNKASFFYKKDEESGQKKLKPEESASFLLNKDSFFIADQFNLAVAQVSFDADFDNKYFLKYLMSLGQYDFAEMVNVNDQLLSTLTGSHYVFRMKGSSVWNSVPTSKQGITAAAQRYPLYNLLSDYTTGELLENSHPSEILRHLEYRFKLKNELPIFLDQWGNKVTRERDVYYKVTISQYDSLCRLDYLRGDILCYTSENKVEDPNGRNGFVSAYYPNGTLRKVTKYVNGQIDDVKEYYLNGLLHYHYIIDRTYSSLLITTASSTFKFLQVQDKNGHPLIDIDGNGAESLFDDFNQRTITRSFKDGYLISSRINESERYQWVGNHFNTEKLKFDWKNYPYFRNHSLLETKYLHVQGHLLSKVEVDEKGKMKAHELLNELHPEVDQLVDEFYAFGTRDKFSYKSEKMWVDGDKVRYEVVIPVRLKPNDYTIGDFFGLSW